jgi:hypothetical protein
MSGMRATREIRRPKFRHGKHNHDGQKNALARCVHLGEQPHDAIVLELAEDYAPQGGIHG